MADRDTLVLLDVLISGRLAMNFLAKVTWSEFLGDILIQDAVIRRLEIMGVAARHLSPSIRKELEHIPWHEMDQISQGLYEGYDSVNIAVVWDIVTYDVPVWIKALEVILPTPQNSLWT